MIFHSVIAIEKYKKFIQKFINSFFYEYDVLLERNKNLTITFLTKRIIIV